MIGIDSVPAENDIQPVVAVDADTAVGVEATEAIDAEAGDPAADPAADSTAEPLIENTDDLLRRLEEEKEEWQRQLAAMKETLEAQDRKIDEDRSKREEALENIREANKTALVPVNKAPTRKVVIGTQQHMNAARIPVVSERNRTVWPGMAQFHERRAKMVSKVMPSFAYQALGRGPARYGVGQRALASTAYNPQNYNPQDFNIDSMGRMVRRAKVLSQAAVPSNMTTRRTTGGSVIVSASGYSGTPSTPQYGSALTGASLVPSTQRVSAGYAVNPPSSHAQPMAQAAGQVAAYDSSGGWLSPTVEYISAGASYIMGYPESTSTPTVASVASSAMQMPKTQTIQRSQTSAPMNMTAAAPVVNAYRGPGR
jgi:hypothetical protein